MTCSRLRPGKLGIYAGAYALALSVGLRLGMPCVQHARFWPQSMLQGLKSRVGGKNDTATT